MAERFKNHLTGMTVAVAAVIATIGGAGAQTVEPPADTPWVKICNTDPQSNKEICVVTQELRTDTGQFLASVAVREIAGEARKTLLLAVPLAANAMGEPFIVTLGTWQQIVLIDFDVRPRSRSYQIQVLGQ